MSRRTERRGPRARTIGLKQLPTDDVEAPLADFEEQQRPRRRADCVDGIRPCPWVSCRYHLYLEVTFAGSLTLRFPDLEPDELEHSCALDLADSGPKRLIEIGQVLNVTRERIRQLEVMALFAARAAAKQHRISEDVIDAFAHPLGNRTEDAA